MKPKQIKYTVSPGTGRDGRERLARWEQAAFIVFKQKRQLPRWIRMLCDKAAAKILGASPTEQ